jgi:SpoVK/Ycf46/Vps4 family AAA+-type ATPase
MILRPGPTFDGDDLEGVIARWCAQAPAILVIEDLNWLLKKVDLSLFLNLIDGIERSAKAGSLLIATTNHPQELDPAINNRPGRFDVVIEVPCPDHTSRLEFLDRRLPDVAETIRCKLASLSDGFSFAHLHELLRLSGLRAIHHRRDRRSDADLLDAVNTLRATIDDAARGFPAKPELPFGLHHVRAARRATEED